jgi:choline kinase
MKLIILAAGDSYELDGFNKLTIKHPKYNMSIIDIYKKIFNVNHIQVVVGFRAMNIMNDYPDFDYILNNKWQTTGSAYSLSLALDENPSYIISSDFILNPQLDQIFNSDNQNVVYVKKPESKRLTSLKCKVNNDIIENIYRGKSKNMNDYEILGIFKITDPDILYNWKIKSINNPTMYAGETLIMDNFDLSYKIIDEDIITEINTPLDYINFLNRINQ